MRDTYYYSSNVMRPEPLAFHPDNSTRPGYACQRCGGLYWRIRARKPELKKYCPKCAKIVVIERRMIARRLS